MDKIDESWHPGTEIPPVARGTEGEFIVAVFRAGNSKVYSFAASYLNELPLYHPNGCDECDGERDGCPGCPVTGWFFATEEGGYYTSVNLEGGDELLGWRNIPQWPSEITTET